MEDTNDEPRPAVEWSPFDPETESAELIAFLCGNTWPFHVNTSPDEPTVTKRIDSGDFGNNESARGFWGRVEGDAAAFVALQELEDPTPVFDLRVAEAWRRRGVGRSALRFLSTWVFEDANKHRVEAHTRADNTAMRALLRSEGWVQEAHHRRAWPDADGAWHDATSYGLLRDDVRENRRTPRPPLDD